MADAQAAGTFTGKPQEAQATRPPQELTSILTQVQSLQSDRERLLRELEETKGKVEKLQVPPRAPLFDPEPFPAAAESACH